MVLVMIPIISVAFIFYQKEGSQSPEKFSVFNMSESVFQPNSSVDPFTLPSRLNILIKAVSPDFKSMTLKMRVQFIPTGNFTVSDRVGFLQVNDSSIAPDSSVLKVVFGSFKEKTFKSKKIMESMTISVPMIDGDLGDFPFDKFTFRFPVFGLNETIIDNFSLFRQERKELNQSADGRLRRWNAANIPRCYNVGCLWREGFIKRCLPKATAGEYQHDSIRDVPLFCSVCNFADVAVVICVNDNSC